MREPLKLRSLPDGSLIAPDGRLVHFSCQRFIDDICLGDCCFVCGAPYDKNRFNDEHVLPRWLLKRHKLWNHQISLPNNDGQNYPSYVLPCCKICNSELGTVIESPISKMFGEIRPGVSLDEGKAFLLFVWFCLLFTKTHLKDREMPVHRDRRKEGGKIADVYDWSSLHHAHAVARAPLFGAGIDGGVIGSLFAFEIAAEVPEPFDWIDLFESQTVGLRTNNLALVCVLNDSGAVARNLADRLPACPLTAVQFREVVAIFAARNLDLLERPRFYTEPLPSGGPASHVIRTDREPELFGPPNIERYGGILAFVMRDLLDRLQLDGSSDHDELTAKLKTGRYTFIGSSATPR